MVFLKITEAVLSWENMWNGGNNPGYYRLCLHFWNIIHCFEISFEGEEVEKWGYQQSQNAQNSYVKSLRILHFVRKAWNRSWNIRFGWKWERKQAGKKNLPLNFNPSEKDFSQSANLIFSILLFKNIIPFTLTPIFCSFQYSKYLKYPFLLFFRLCVEANDKLLHLSNFIFLHRSTHFSPPWCFQ